MTTTSTAMNGHHSPEIAVQAIPPPRATASPKTTQCMRLSARSLANSSVVCGDELSDEYTSRANVAHTPNRMAAVLPFMSFTSSCLLRRLNDVAAELRERVQLST